MSRYLDVCSTSQVAKIMVQCGRSSGSSWTKSVWSHHLPDNCGGRPFEQGLLGLGWEKSPELGMLIRASKTGSIPIQCTWMISKWMEGNRNSIRCNEIGWFGRTDITSWPCTLGMHSTWMQTERKYRISAGPTEKLPGWEKSHANTIAWSYDMEGDARKCVKRHRELANESAEQLYGVSTPCLDNHFFF